MKHLKILLPLIAVVFAVAGVFAMRANSQYKTQVKTRDVEFWDYNGIAGGEANAASYSLGTSTPTHSSCGLQTTTVCQIQAQPDPSDPSKPDLNGENPIVNQSDFQTTLRGNN